MLSLERKQSLASRALTYAQNLPSDAQAISYLTERGISKEVAAMFSLGVVSEGEMFAGRLSIPYIMLYGVVDIKYRATDGSMPKYGKEAGCGVHLYNAPMLKHARTVALTEGELDAITVQAYCGIAAVAYPGADTWKNQRHWPLCFEGVHRVYVIADGDAVGREAASRVADSIGWSARVVDLGEGLDANAYIAQHGAEAFKERLTK